MWNYTTLCVVGSCTLHSRTLMASFSQLKPDQWSWWFLNQLWRNSSFLKNCTSLQSNSLTGLPQNLRSLIALLNSSPSLFPSSQTVFLLRWQFRYMVHTHTNLIIKWQVSKCEGAPPNTFSQFLKYGQVENFPNLLSSDSLVLNNSLYRVHFFLLILWEARRNQDTPSTLRNFLS